MQRLIVVMLRAAVIGGIWRGLRWVINWWANRGGPPANPAEQRQRREAERRANRSLSTLRRLTRWIR
ncbi:MAG: hypothetical protein AAF415_17490 [Pseudomonadota bacterium]